MFSALLLALVSALIIDASPVRKSASSPVLSCPSATVNADLPYDFTFAAMYLNGPNDNTTGVPLVLGDAGAIDGAEMHIVETYATYPYDDLPWITLTSAELKAYYVDGTTSTNATGCEPGGSISFLSTADYPPFDVYPAPIFLAISCPGNPYPFLSANGHVDQWSLFPTQYGGTVLTYNASAESSQYQTYNVSDCAPVAVNIVPYLA